MTQMHEGPFEYLKKHVRPEADAFVRVSLEAAPQDSISAHGVPTRSGQQAAISTGQSACVGVRAAAEHLLRKGNYAALDNIQILANVAFDDPDSLVRGAAWWLLADLWEKNPEREGLVDFFIKLLAVRFKLDRNSAALESATRAWIDGITYIARRALGKVASRQLTDKFLDRFAAEDRERLEASASAAQEFLGHADHERRLAAMSVLVRAEPNAAWLRERIRKLVLDDPNATVKEAALAHLSTLHLGSRDRSLLGFLARLVLSDEQPVRLRFLAYHGLFVVQGHPPAEWPMSRAMAESRDVAVKFFAGGEQWPGEIDWGLVTSFLD